MFIHRCTYLQFIIYYIPIKTSLQLVETIYLTLDVRYKIMKYKSF